MVVAEASNAAASRVLAKGIAQNFFWFLVLVSWLPVVAGYTGFADNFLPWRWGPLDADRWLAVPVPHLFLTIAIAIAVLALYLEKPLLLLCAAAPLLANFLGAPGIPGSRNAAFYASIAYLVAFAASFVLFAAYSHLRSLPVFVFLLVCGWDSAFHTAVDIWEFVKNLFVWAEQPEPPALPAMTILHVVLANYSAAETDFIIFFAVLVFGRFLALLWQQNVVLVHDIWDKAKKGSPPQRAQSWFVFRSLVSTYLWPSFKLWWPMLAVFVFFGVILYPTLTDLMAQQIAIAIQDDLIGPESKKKYDPAKGDNPQFEPMVRHLIEYNRLTLIEQSKSKIDGLQLAAVKTTQELNTVVYKKLEKEIFPPRLPGTQTSGCRKTSIPCHAKNGVKSVANSGYRRLRDPPLSRTKLTLERLHKEAQGRGQEFAQKAKAALEQEITTFAAETNVAFDKVLYAGRMFSLIMLIYSIMVLVKTYGIVLARHIFDTRNTQRFHASISARVRNPARAKTIYSDVEHVTTPTLPLTKRQALNYYVARDVSLPAGLAMPWLPSPTKAILTRLRNRRYLLAHVDVVGGQFDPVYVQLPGPLELVRWEIADGERVVFRFQDLVGMSDGVRIESVITFSLEALVFGRAVFHTAVGKGVLLLQTGRSPVVSPDPQAQKPRDVGSLISWHTRTPFEIHSRLSIKGVFAHGYNVEKQATGKVVYTPGATGGSAHVGIARWIRTFMSPI